MGGICVAFVAAIAAHRRQYQAAPARPERRMFDLLRI
jgi:hypothetical protein